MFHCYYLVGLCVQKFLDNFEKKIFVDAIIFVARKILVNSALKDILFPPPYCQKLIQ